MINIMSTYTMSVSGNGTSHTITVFGEETILEALRRSGITDINAPCGGAGKCRRCSVILDGKEVLACRTVPGRDCSVTLLSAHRAVVETRGAGNIRPCGDGLGLAVDIGTTTLAAFLYDLSTGQLLAVESGRNAQRAYGADVISRIVQADKPGGLDALRLAVRGQISSFIDALCAKTGYSRADITRVSIAGNTVMEHIFDNLSPAGIGIAPFTALSLFGDLRHAEGVLDGLSDRCEVYLCPALAGYVGGDITAGLLGSGAADCGELSLFLDVGTNGEMALGDKNGYVCCAAAAGPAFEGAEIECGMDGSAGAVDSVRYVNHSIETHVIGDVPAMGICGSGLIDAIAAMIECGAVSYSGRMTPPDEAPEHIAGRLRYARDGSLRFYLTDSVYVSAQDVREVQLAKAAIRAGIETLLSLCGKKSKDVENVFIAGGFGAYMDLHSACLIGLLPAEFESRAAHVGNAAGAGAAMSLDIENRRRLEELTAQCSYHELSGSAVFNDFYIESMPFEEAEE